ncbi:MAG: hypothetical protein AB7P07_12195 [Hyphomonadaceae bacterium]
MLRTAIFALALGLPGMAVAEEFPHSALGLEVRSDEGTVMSRVEAVERDGDGRIVAVEAPGLAPADAPAAASDLVAEQDGQRFLINYRAAERNDRTRAGGAVQIAAR